MPRKPKRYVALAPAAPSPASRTDGPSLLEVQRRYETAELVLEQCGERDRGVVFEPRADELYSNWQARC